MNLQYYKKRIKIIFKNEGLLVLLESIILKLLTIITSERTVFKIQTAKNDFINKIKYDAPADPYKKLKIHPNDIEGLIKKGRWNGEMRISPTKWGLGQIKGGDWDKGETRKSAELTNIEYFKQRFKQGKERTETKKYRKFREKKQELTEKEAKDKFAEQVQPYEELYRDIEQNGYKEGHSGERLKPNSQESSVRLELEVEVTIDRNGKINLKEGLHRYAIVSALGIEIPVHVVRRHKKWQQYRDKICRGEIENIPEHPDLEDIRETN